MWCDKPSSIDLSRGVMSHSNNTQRSPNKRTLIEQQIMIFAREQSFKICTPFLPRFKTNLSYNLFQITLLHIKASVAQTGDFRDH